MTTGEIAMADYLSDVLFVMGIGAVLAGLMAAPFVVWRERYLRRLAGSR